MIVITLDLMPALVGVVLSNYTFPVYTHLHSFVTGHSFGQLVLQLLPHAIEQEFRSSRLV